MKAWMAAMAASFFAMVCVVGCGGGLPDASHAGDAKTGKVEILDAGTFDATIREGVVLVDFWAPWCGPCRIQGPIVEKVAGRVGGRARIAKLDVDQAASLAQHYEIKSIPTLIVFKEGKPVKRFVGVTQADPLVSAITKAL